MRDSSKNLKDYANVFKAQGFLNINGLYTDAEIEMILGVIGNADSSKPTFRKTNDLFAIRQFLKEVPGIARLIFNARLLRLINQLFSKDFFVVKSIYFDKPEGSNWFVAYHQDLTISVDKKLELDGFGPWTTKQGQFAVQPPLSILEDNFTIRIHLDDTNEENGALKVIPGSHLKGEYRPETIDRTVESEVFCNVERGGAMLMRPLLLHASNRTLNNQRRRVIHIEFSRTELPQVIEWSEKMEIRDELYTGWAI